jgi:hypothetical protein
MNQQQRRAALAAVLTADFSGWSGLPAGCTAEDFAALSAGEIAAGVGRLATVPVAYRDFAGYPGLLRVFFDDAGHAFLVWADWSPGAVGAIVAALGPAEAVLVDLPSRRPGTVQQVWGAAGLAAYVADDGSVAGLALFAPASPAVYRVNLGGSEGPPYRPRPARAADDGERSAP